MNTFTGGQPTRSYIEIHNPEGHNNISVNVYLYTYWDHIMEMSYKNTHDNDYSKNILDVGD